MGGFVQKTNSAGSVPKTPFVQASIADPGLLRNLGQMQMDLIHLSAAMGLKGEEYKELLAEIRLLRPQLSELSYALANNGRKFLPSVNNLLQSGDWAGEIGQAIRSARDMMAAGQDLTADSFARLTVVLRSARLNVDTILNARVDLQPVRAFVANLAPHVVRARMAVSRMWQQAAPARELIGTAALRSRALLAESSAGLAEWGHSLGVPGRYVLIAAAILAAGVIVTGGVYVVVSVNDDEQAPLDESDGGTTPSK